MALLRAEDLNKSFGSVTAAANISGRVGLQTICTMPSRSRKSMKITPP